MELTTISVVRRYKIRRALKQIRKKIEAYEGKEPRKFGGEIEYLAYKKQNNPDIINEICKGIVEALPGIKELKKEVDFGPLEEEIYKVVVSGYFRAAHLFIRAYRKSLKLADKDNADSCMTKATDLLKQRGYFREMGKIIFDGILKESDFKTGPLLKSDIEYGKYLETLHKNANDYLNDLLRATGCYGISGERGMGKSTLINKFVYKVENEKKIPDSVIIKMSMPTEYKDEEFLTALFLKFCDATKESIKKSHLFSFIIGLLDIPSFAYHYSIPIAAITALIALILSEGVSGDFRVTYFTLIVLVLTILSMVRLLRLVFSHLNKRIKTYYEIEAIDNDIRYKKTLEIKEGVGPQLFMLGKTATFKDNPVKYSGPLLSERLKDTIETVAKFSKVIFLIDDLDKQEGKQKIRRILKNLRFLSSVGNCLTIVSVRAELADEFKDKDSEVRTLFDDIWKLRTLERDTLIELIKRRIIFGEFADIFLKEEEIIRNYEEFWKTLLDASDKVPREAIRLFHRSFQHWFEKRDIKTLDEALEEKKPKQLRIVRATERPKKIEIEYESGSAIDLSEVNMEIEVNKKRTTVSPVAEGTEEERFAVHNTMVIDMEKLIARGDNAITINADGKGVTVGTISDGIALSDWKEGTTVKVTLVYVPTGELLMAMKRTI